MGRSRHTASRGWRPARPRASRSGHRLGPPSGKRRAHWLGNGHTARPGHPAAVPDRDAGTVRPRMDPAVRLCLGAAACFVSLARRHRGGVRRLGRQLQLGAQCRVLHLQPSALRFQRRDADRQLINTRQQRRDQRVPLGSRQRRNIGHQTLQTLEPLPHPQLNTTSQPAPAKPRRRCSAILPIAHPNRRVSKYLCAAHSGLYEYRVAAFR